MYQTDTICPDVHSSHVPTLIHFPSTASTAVHKPHLTSSDVHTTHVSSTTAPSKGLFGTLYGCTLNYIT